MSDARAQAERELLVVFDKADLSELAECATAMQRAGQILDAFAAEQTALWRHASEQWERAAIVEMQTAKRAEEQTAALRQDLADARGERDHWRREAERGALLLREIRDGLGLQEPMSAAHVIAQTAALRALVGRIQAEAETAKKRYGGCGVCREPWDFHRPDCFVGRIVDLLADAGPGESR